MAHTWHRHLPPKQYGATNAKRRARTEGRQLSKPTKQRRANERAALRKEYR